MFFYQKKSPEQRDICLMYQEDYLFAKVGICADSGSWLERPLPEEGELSEEAGGEAPAQEGEAARENRGSWLKRHRQERTRRREQKRRQQEYMQKMQEYEEQRLELAENMRRLKAEVFSEMERAGGTGSVRCVYESGLRFLADARGEAALCWSRVWDIPEFRDYKSLRWVQPLMGYVRHSDFILLGRADCIPVILQGLARQMKSLQWYLREEELDEEVQGWAEDFYEEYGLAVTLRGRTGRNAFRKLGVQAVKPVCVMDFMEEETFLAEELPEDSVWLDFASVDGKAGRIRRQAPGVSYMSLKKYWSAKTKVKPIIPAEHAASRFRLS